MALDKEINGKVEEFTREFVDRGRTSGEVSEMVSRGDVVMRGGTMIIHGGEELCLGEGKVSP